MAKDDKVEPTEELLDEEELVSRRGFFVGLGKWSKVVIGLALFGGTLAMPENDADARAFAWAMEAAVAAGPTAGVAAAAP